MLPPKKYFRNTPENVAAFEALYPDARDVLGGKVSALAYKYIVMGEYGCTNPKFLTHTNSLQSLIDNGYAELDFAKDTRKFPAKHFFKNTPENVKAFEREFPSMRSVAGSLISEMDGSAGEFGCGYNDDTKDKAEARGYRAMTYGPSSPSYADSGFIEYIFSEEKPASDGLMAQGQRIEITSIKDLRRFNELHKGRLLYASANHEPTLESGCRVHFTCNNSEGKVNFYYGFLPEKYFGYEKYELPPEDSAKGSQEATVQQVVSKGFYDFLKDVHPTYIYPKCSNVSYPLKENLMSQPKSSHEMTIAQLADRVELLSARLNVMQGPERGPFRYQSPGIASAVAGFGWRATKRIAGYILGPAPRWIQNIVFLVAVVGGGTAAYKGYDWVSKHVKFQSPVVKAETTEVN